MTTTNFADVIRAKLRADPVLSASVDIEQRISEIEIEAFRELEDERDAAIARAEAAECDVVALRRQWNELDKRNEKRHREWSEQLSIVTDELVALRRVAEAARKLVPWPYLNAQDTYLVPLSNALSALAATPAAQETRS